MATTKEVNMFLNFQEDTPDEIIQQLRNFKVNNTYDETTTALCNDYRHACGAPVIDFYATRERLNQYQKDDGTYYLRYCNTIKDYADNFEAWLDTIAPWVIQINGHHVGTIYNSDNEKMQIICIKKGKVAYKTVVESD